MILEDWGRLYQEANSTCESTKLSLVFSKDVAESFPESDNYNRLLNNLIEKLFKFVDQYNLSSELNEPDIRRRYDAIGSVGGGFGSGLDGISRKYSVVMLILLKLNQVIQGELSTVAKTENALAYLNRRLFLLEDFRSRWQTAFAERTEPVLERLGGLHLFECGIHAFKANGPREATDLILAEDVLSTTVQMPLIMTEWKKSGIEDVNTKIEEAIAQCERYDVGIARPLQIKKFRFIIIVSASPLKIEEKRSVGQNHYLVKNIVINRSNPSIEARQS